jgi:hypothetical protein
MRKAAYVVAVVFVLGVVGGSVGAAWAQSCHEGGSGGGCGMTGCPGEGQTMTALSGKVTQIAPEHNLISVKKGSKTLGLAVHPDCPNKAQLTEQIGKLKVGQTLKCTYYTKEGKTYLCQIGGAPSCH